MALHTVRCPVCTPWRQGRRLVPSKVQQGAYGNCAACWRQLRRVRKSGGVRWAKAIAQAERDGGGRRRRRSNRTYPTV